MFFKSLAFLHLKIMFCLKFDAIHKNILLLRHICRVNAKLLSDRHQTRCYESERNTANFAHLLSSETKTCLSRTVSAKQLQAYRCLSEDVKQSLEAKLKKLETEKKIVAPSNSSAIGISGFDADEFTKPEVADTEWITIYKFPLILYVRMFSRLKLFQTIAALVSCPLTFALYLSDVVSLETFSRYCLCSVFACGMLYVFGNIFRRIVGIVYISSDRSRVRFARLSFFGNRIDEDVDIIDIVPIVSINHELNDYFCRIERFSTNEIWFMSLKFGGIYYNEGFNQVFGEKSSDKVVNKKS